MPGTEAHGPEVDRELRPVPGSGRHAAGWFIRRAGLARFTTFNTAAGLALAAVCDGKPVVALAGLTGAVLGTMTALAWSRGQRRRRARIDLANLSGHGGRAGGHDGSPARMWLLIVSVLLTGLFSGYLVGNVRVAALQGGTLQARIGETVRAELCVTGPVRSYGGWQSATAVVQAASGGGGEALLLEIGPAGDNASAPVALVQGMIVGVTGTIVAPEGPSESGYDQAKTLLHQGLEVVLRVDDPGAVTEVGRRGGVSGWFDRLRQGAKAHLSRGPSAAVNEVLQGVVMGDTLGIDEDWMTAFRRSGTAHMLSVSGLHVAALAAIMIGLARLLRAARWVGFLLAAVSSLMMIPFVGASPPIIRSAAMICVVLIGRWVGRSRDQWQVLALAAVVVLVLNPYALFDVGFQLSFAAFVGMLVFLGPLQRALRRLPQTVAANVAVSVAASAGTAPVALAVFDKTSLVSPLANLLVVPTLPLVTGLGMASVFLGFVWSGLSTVLDALASLPMMWTVQVSRLMALAPVLQTGDLGRACFALAAGVLTLPVALALTGRSVRAPLDLPLPLFKRSIRWLRARRPRGRRRAVVLATVAVLLAAVVGGWAYAPVVRGVQAVQAAAHGRSWPDQVEVRVLDVGQGNAVLVRTPGRHALLFDGGPAGCGLAGQLRDLGVSKLDVAVISHPHADHFAGLLEALGSVEVETLIDQVEVVSEAVWTAGSPARAGPAGAGAGAAGVAAGGGSWETSAYLQLRRELLDDGCRHVLAATGDGLTVEGVEVRLYAPPKPLVLVDGADPWVAEGGQPTGDELNGASLVAVVSVGGVDLLVPGDAEADVLRRYDLPATEAVVVPHHGSRGAVAQQLLTEWGTRAAFVSVGAGNSFGHPAAGTIAVLEASVGTVLRTDSVGWVSCMVNGDHMVITTERTPAR